MCTFCDAPCILLQVHLDSKTDKISFVRLCFRLGRFLTSWTITYTYSSSWWTRGSRFATFTRVSLKRIIRWEFLSLQRSILIVVDVILTKGYVCKTATTCLVFLYLESFTFSHKFGINILRYSYVGVISSMIKTQMFSNMIMQVKVVERWTFCSTHLHSLMLLLAKNLEWSFLESSIP